MPPLKKMEHLQKSTKSRHTPSSTSSLDTCSAASHISRHLPRFVILACIAAWCLLGQMDYPNTNLGSLWHSRPIVWASAELSGNNDNIEPAILQEIEQHEYNPSNILLNDAAIFQKYPAELVSLIQHAMLATDSLQVGASNPLSEHVNPTEEEELDAINAHLEDEEILERLHTCFVAIYRHFDLHNNAYIEIARTLAPQAGMREEDIVQIASHNHWIACYFNMEEGDGEKIVANTLSQEDEFRLLKRTQNTPTRFSKRQMINLERLLKTMQEQPQKTPSKPPSTSRFFNLSTIGAFVIIISLLYLGYHALTSSSTRRVSPRTISKEEKRGGKYKKHR
ncbi:hypothetical protein IE077_003853 [Cardiosporidium cionae]|uniref:Transmembrane protein n=1 Tax=Cardiosporidium cionae TaxID=476202 RepID=A0ABQ7JEF5_9APIC|nr:hypothetical protein IE077_003853 [Cardiosporidium cionae]|eukprot:KAF8822392.1 hypothetical protein IE077_003853 [Cardiosporidium cionae]